MFDVYGPTVKRKGPLSLGGVGLSKGRHETTLTVTAKNPAARAYYAGLDVFMLERSGKGEFPDSHPAASGKMAARYGTLREVLWRV